jgi:hypothetical protein
MDKVTQQNASGAEESASAAEELSAQAGTTASLVSELMVLVRGNDARRTNTAVTPVTARAPVHRQNPAVHPPKPSKPKSGVKPHREGSTAPAGSPAAPGATEHFLNLESDAAKLGEF